MIGTKEIFESGFVKAFISEYFEYKMHSYYPDKDRLLYILCNSEDEKIEVTNKQIEYTKSEIKNLGWEALSFAYLLSSKAESGPNYIEHDKRFDFWLKHFAEDFQDNTDSFCPILAALLYLSEDTESDENSSNTRLVESQTESDENFWEIFPKSLRPKNKDLSIEYLVALETEIEDLIRYNINEFTESGWWNFDFEEYENFIESNKVIENLFEISELFVQLNRLDMFKGFLIPFSQVESETKPLKEIASKINNNITLKELIPLINNAFFKLEALMNGTINEYKYFGFNDTFTLLFNEVKKPENYTYENCKLIDDYWKLNEQIRIDYDKGDFENESAFENDDFCKDCDEITHLNWERIDEFCYFSISDESTERKFSITDILKNNTLPHAPVKKKVKQNKELTLSDFLINKSDLVKFISIQKEFKQYEGKRLAILIHLLQIENKIISIISKSKTHSRKHFICIFKEDESFDKEYAVNKYIDPFTSDLIIPTLKIHDSDYIDIKQKLTKILENPVV